MKFFYAISAYFFISISLQAQQIKVLDKLTKEPIAEVALYNTENNKSAITNFKGEADISVFKAEEVIHFQHISYDLKSIQKKKATKNNTVFLNLNTQGLNEIVISASKFNQSRKDIPQKISSINANKIAFSNPQTSADLLEKSGQVYIQKSQLGGGSPIIRGFSTNRLLITVDGVRMNNAIFRGGNVQNVISIDPFTISSTEITLGSGSVIYGSDAIGGVMSFYTTKPKLSYTDTLSFNGTSVIRYATANKEKTGHINLNFGLKKWAFLSSFSYSSFDDLKMGKHGKDDYLRPEYVNTVNDQDLIVQNENPLIQRFTGYNQTNFLQKARYEYNDNLSFDLGVFYTTTSNFNRYDRLIRYQNNQLRSAEWYYGPQRWFMSNLQVTKLSSRSNLHDKIKATVSYQNFQESRINRDFQSEIRNTNKEKVDAYSANIDFEKSIGSKTKLFYGLEYVYNKVYSEASEENIQTHLINNTVTRYPNNSQWQSAAVYTSLKYKSNSKFVFQSGLRYNHVSLKANFLENNAFLNLPFNSTKINTGAFTGTAGIIWNTSKLMQWNFNLSTAFRAPNIDDVGKVFDSEPGSVVVPNNNLKAEHAYGGELGLKFNFNKLVKLDLSTYYTYLDNALVRRDFTLNGESEIIYNGELSSVQAIQNASKAWIYGFEIGLEINFTKHLQLTSQYNIIGGTEEEEDGTEAPIRHVAPNFGNTHLIWKAKKFTFDVYSNYNAELSFNQLATSEIEKDYIYALDENGNPYSPSWATLNAKTQYTFNDSISLNLGLENITDKRYRTYSSGLSAPGINFIASLKYSF